MFFQGEEHADLMGHEVTFYTNGVLLTLKDKHKTYPDLEKSFIFYNNKGEKEKWVCQ